MIKAYFPPYEEVPDSAFEITPEVEKKLEPYKPVPTLSDPPKTFGDLLKSERFELYQRQNSADTGTESQPKHFHYFKDVGNLNLIDVYRVLQLYEVTDPCLQHAIKKLLVAGGRGAKDKPKDVQECIDTLKRWQQMKEENLK